MTKKIALITDKKGSASTLFDNSHIKVYFRDEGKWNLTEDFLFEVDIDKGMADVRIKIEELVARLNSCRVIAGLKFAGVAYNVLDKAGFSIIEVDFKTEDVLDYILEMIKREELQRESENSLNEIPKPIQTETEGEYFINLIEAQKKQPDISSKKILMPFLKNNNFYKLDVIFSHIPPWINEEKNNLNIIIESSRISSNEYKMTIWKKTCNN
ncbi:UNVERIFIED_CONTAM: Fe-only nitrogenase accessory protein AnfO [Acetivibrio alkalicellulosi]